MSPSDEDQVNAKLEDAELVAVLLGRPVPEELDIGPCIFCNRAVFWAADGLPVCNDCAGENESDERR